MEKVRINNDLLVKYTVFRDGQPESFVGATDITVTVTNEAYKKAIPNTFDVVSNIVNISIDAADFNLCGKYRVTLKYVRGNDIEIDALAFEGVQYTSLTGGTEIVGVEVVTVNISGDIGIAIPDNNKIDLDGLNSDIQRLQFDTVNPVAGAQAGQVYWSDEEKTLVLNDGYHTHPIGKELGPLVKNNSGQTILNGQACYVTGSTGDNPTIGLATTTNPDVAQKTIGLATMDIPNNGFGIVTTFGEVNDIDTSALTLGAIVYLGANGTLTTTEPVAPTPKIVIGICVRQHAQVGKLFVSTRPIARLSKLSEVHAPTLTDNDVLRWNGTTLRWEVYSLAGKADLVGGKVPTSQLPSYVDDVLEYANLAAFPTTGETGKIYVALNTNLTYRWSGTTYVEISKSLALGETADTAYRGDRGKTAYDHSQTTGNPHNTTAAQIQNTPASTVAATTVQGAINELASDIVQVETDLKLLTDPYLIEGRVDSAGIFRDTTAAMRTDYIPVLYGLEITAYDGGNSEKGYRACAFYDKDKKFISCVAFETAGVKTFIIDESNIPENAYYFVSSTLNQYILVSKISLPNRIVDNISYNKELINEANEKIDEANEKIDEEISKISPYSSVSFSEEKTPAKGSRATWSIPISNNKLPITVKVDLISGGLTASNWRIYYSDKSSAIAFTAFDGIPYGESRTFYLPDGYTGIYVFCIGKSVDGTATAKVTFMQESLADVVGKNTNEIDNIKGDIVGLETSVADANAVRYLPQNVFGNVLPKSFKSKYFGGEQDVEIVCVGDSLTGLINGCTAFTIEEQQHLPPGLTRNHWTYQLWNRLNLNKPSYNRADAIGIFTKIGAFASVSGGKFDLPSRHGEYSTSDLTFQSADLNASAQFSWDLDVYKKCNIIYSANQDGAISEIVIGGGNGLIEVSTDKTTWQEANGFEVNQNTIPSGSTYTEETAYQFGIALHQRHRRIWMRAKETASGIQSITYRRKSTDTDPLHYFYFWGTEMWNQQSLFLTNIGRGGRNTDLLNCNLTDVSDRKPDLLIYAMPLANETNKVNFSTIKPYYNSYFFSETSNKGSIKTISNDYQDFDVMMVMPHGRSAYFDGNQAVHYESTPIEPVFNHIYMKSVFSYVEELSENYKDQFANINLMEQLYNEGFARGMTLQNWLAGGSMTSDGIHLNDLGATLWAKYLAPIFQ